MTEPFIPFLTIEGDPKRGLVLLCDHARNTLPDDYGTLGLPALEFERHIAYDIGVEAVTRGLAKRLNVPAVQSCFSRLLIDPNRGEDDPTLVMRLSDGTVIPGNYPIEPAEVENRSQQYHRPYHDAITETIEACLEAGTHPLIFSIHSFTPHWKGVQRPWHATMLWDGDRRLADLVVGRLQEISGIISAHNEPYDGSLQNDTMYRHATSRGLGQGLLEIRQDLIADSEGVERMVEILTPILEEALTRPDITEKRFYGSRSDGTANGDYTR